MKSGESPLTALMVAPNRQLAETFQAALAASRSFEVLQDLKSYPTVQALDIRLRQLRPEVLLVDLSADIDIAAELIRVAAATHPDTHIVGLDDGNDSDTVLRALRSGASEFLYAPFDVAVQVQAVERLKKLRKIEPVTTREMGKVMAFSSAKSGSGCSTLAAQTAIAVQRRIKGRVLLADFDLQTGALGFYMKLSPEQSMLDALRHSDHLDAAFWAQLTSSAGGLDVIPAPEEPFSGNVDPARLIDILNYARSLYDWIVVDLPVVFHRTSLMTLSECDKVYLVSTGELPSLHLTRKAINLLRQIGLGKDRYFVVVNRTGRGTGVDNTGMEKIFSSPIHATIPEDASSLNRVVTLGEPLDSSGDLGKAIGGLATQMSGLPEPERRRAARGALAVAPLFHES